MEERARKIGIGMSILMGFTLSLCLSLLGSLTSGHFAWPTFLLSFAISFIISLLIGFLVPMAKVNANLEHSLNLKPRSLPAMLVEALASDLIYTPAITLAMISLNYKIAVSHGAQLVFVPMFLKSLGLSLLVAYVLILIFTPLFLKILIKNKK